MNRPCPERETALLDRAAGLLDEAGEATLRRHLEGCPGCRAEAEALERALGLAALPPVPPAERDAVAAAGPGALRKLRSARRGRRRAWGAGFAAAAAVLLALAVPGVLRGRPAVRPPAEAAAAGGSPAGSPAGTLADAAPPWSIPDLDAAWEASAAADPAGDDEVPGEMLFAELQEVDLDPE